MDGKFKVFVVVAFLVVFLGMVGGGYVVLKSVSNNASTVQAGGSVKNPQNIVIFPIAGDITTNLISEVDDQSKHVIKITVGFGIDKKGRDFKALSKEFVEKEMLIRNEIIQSLRDQSYESMAKPDAQAKLSEIIVSRLSTLLVTQSIEDMYFGDFFVQ
ncbi:MAG TPA: hypothetical protein GX707_02460 [Epulopiscium sp.]|nr:hypothetical protein [Candidatus Epulonipiscium sp.]